MFFRRALSICLSARSVEEPPHIHLHTLPLDNMAMRVGINGFGRIGADDDTLLPPCLAVPCLASASAVARCGWGACGAARVSCNGGRAPFRLRALRAGAGRWLRPID